MYRGVMVPLVTPVAADASVCETDVVAMITMLAPHVAGLVPALSTGEGWALDSIQWRDMVGYTVHHSPSLPVLAGILCASTAEVTDRAGMAATLGAEAVVASTPFGPAVSQEQMYAHYADLAAASPVPVVVYHESAVSGNELELGTLLRICRIPGIVAVKDSCGDSECTRRLVAARPGVAVWQGREQLIRTGSRVDGYVLALANVAPQLCARVWPEPSPDTTRKAAEACRRYGLLDDDWYRNVKTWLHASGIIANARSIVIR
jgi:4-hydroxy-tetrahydrodipicolinate synthase